MPHNHRFDVADLLLLLTFDPSTGRPRRRVPPTRLRPALATALLGELTLHGAIDVTTEGTVHGGEQSPPTGTTAHTVLDHLPDTDPAPTVTACLRTITPHAHRWVLDRLNRTAVVSTVTTRTLLGTSRRVHVLNRPLDAEVGLARLQGHLRRGTRPDLSDLVMAATATRAGMTRLLLDGLPREARHSLAGHLGALPPPLRSLLLHAGRADPSPAHHHRRR